jgi:thiol-disulfide isomerase/thioredoxin
MTMGGWRQTLLVVVIAVLAAGGGYGVYRWQHGGAAAAGPPGAAQAIFAASFDDLSGRQQPLSRWRGKSLVINFWATWCEPCRTEIPRFVKLQSRYGAQGLQFIGIAIDGRDKVSDFARKTGINYPVLIGQADGVDLSRKAGNHLGGLPYTVLIDRHGRVVGTHLGEVKFDHLEKTITEMLDEPVQARRAAGGMG